MGKDTLLSLWSAKEHPGTATYIPPGGGIPVSRWKRRVGREGSETSSCCVIFQVRLISKVLKGVFCVKKAAFIDSFWCTRWAGAVTVISRSSDGVLRGVLQVPSYQV